MLSLMISYWFIQFLICRRCLSVGGFTILVLFLTNKLQLYKIMCVHIFGSWNFSLNVLWIDYFLIIDFFSTFRLLSEENFASTNLLHQNSGTNMAEPTWVHLIKTLLLRELKIKDLIWTEFFNKLYHKNLKTSVPFL